MEMEMQNDRTIKEYAVSNDAREEAERIKERWNGETDANAEFEEKQRAKCSTQDDAKQFLRDVMTGTKQATNEQIEAAKFLASN